MFNTIKRWLGLQDGSGTRSAARKSARQRPNSATSHLYSKDSPALRKSATPDKAGGPRPSRTAATKPAQDDFDPYNTGKFDRGASWERISKTQR